MVTLFVPIFRVLAPFSGRIYEVATDVSEAKKFLALIAMEIGRHIISEDTNFISKAYRVEGEEFSFAGLEVRVDDGGVGVEVVLQFHGLAQAHQAGEGNQASEGHVLLGCELKTVVQY